MATTIYLTTASSSPWTVPSDWNNSNNKIEVIGGGGGGSPGVTATTTTGAGGGGAAYSFVTNLTLSGTVSFTVGGGGAASTAGGDTWFNGASLAASSVGAKGGGGASGATAGTRGLASGSIGTGTEANTPNGASGGGGAGGPGGVGATGGASGASTTFSQNGGGGGGASFAGGALYCRWHRCITRGCGNRAVLYGIAISGNDAAATMAAGGAFGLLLGGVGAASMYFGLLRIPPRHLISGDKLAHRPIGGRHGSPSDCISPAGSSRDFIHSDGLGYVISGGSVIGKVIHTLIGYTDRRTVMQLAVYVTTLATIFTLMELFGHSITTQPVRNAP